MRLPNASELAALLPDWSAAVSGLPSDLPRLGGYDQLKTAAIALASASEVDRRALIAEYSRAYCDLLLTDICAGEDNHASGHCHPHEPTTPQPSLRKASGMYVLIRILFLLPPHQPLSGAPRFSVWATPWWPTEHRGGNPTTPDADLSWPIHEDPGTQNLVVARSMAFYIDGPDPVYRALAEYDYFAARYPMRTPATLRAMRIKLTDQVQQGADPHKAERRVAQ